MTQFKAFVSEQREALAARAEKLRDRPPMESMRKVAQTSAGRIKALRIAGRDARKGKGVVGISATRARKAVA